MEGKRSQGCPSKLCQHQIAGAQKNQIPSFSSFFGKFLASSRFLLVNGLAHHPITPSSPSCQPWHQSLSSSLRRHPSSRPRPW